MVKSGIEIWLDFIARLLWPLTILIGLGLFRWQIRSLISRISSLKVFNIETIIQGQSSDAISSGPIDSSQIQATAAGVFVTESTIREVIRASGLIPAGDEIYRAMQIYSTNTQTTWLFFSKQRVFCVLDDEKTRSNGKLLQWVLPREQALPVFVRDRGTGLGLLDIGVRRNWLYSTLLHPAPELLKEEIERAISEAETS